MRNRLWLVIPLLLVTGCVSKGTYDELKRQFDEQAAALRDREARVQTLEEALAASEREVAGLEATIRELQDQIAQLSRDQANLLKDRASLTASVEQMQRALAEANRRKAEADARIAEYRNLLARFQPLIDAGKLRVKIVDGRMVVELPSDILFPSGSARLNAEGRASIAEVSRVLAEIPDRQFQVEGHTDNVPISTAQYPSNWELAAARAITVTKAMIEAGMAPERLSAASYGEYKPAQPNDTREGRAANRRIEIVVVPDLSSLPGFEELQRVSTEADGGTDGDRT